MIQKIDFVHGELQDYIDHNERRPADYAERIGVTVGEFFKMVAIYKEMKLEEQKKSPVVAEPVSTRKPRSHLTEADRVAIYEAYKGGASRSALAERFGVNPNTISNICFKYRHQDELKAVSQPAPAVMPPGQVIESVLTSGDFDVSFEEEFLMIRINKKHLTRKLLAGVI